MGGGKISFSFFFSSSSFLLFIFLFCLFAFAFACLSSSFFPSLYFFRPSFVFFLYLRLFCHCLCLSFSSFSFFLCLSIISEERILWIQHASRLSRNKLNESLKHFHS